RGVNAAARLQAVVASTTSPAQRRAEARSPRRAHQSLLESIPRPRVSLRLPTRGALPTSAGSLPRTAPATTSPRRRRCGAELGVLPAAADMYKRIHIHDGQTVIASPHKIVGPESNDLVLQLRKRGVSQVVLAGMAANLCVEGHMRELVEQGFEVAVVKDATAGARLPEGDGYLAALVNFRFLASAVWTTAEAVARLKEGDR